MGCLCGKNKVTETPDFEAVCMECGTVIPTDDSSGNNDSDDVLGSGRVNGSGGSSTNSQSPTKNTNLCLLMETGSRQNKKIKGSKFIHPTAHPDLHAVSDITQKLGTPTHIATDIWKWYQRLRPLLLLQRARLLVLIIYNSYRNHDVPLDQNLMYEAIKHSLKVSSVPKYEKVCMEASRYLDPEDGEIIVNKIGLVDWERGTSPASMIRRLVMAYPPHWRRAVTTAALSAYAVLQDTGLERHRRARMAVRTAGKSVRAPLLDSKKESKRR